MQKIIKKNMLMEIENIVFVEYNGANRPFQVWTNKNKMYDLFMKGGYLYAEWTGGGKPYINKFIEGIKPRKVWFKEEFRPTNGAVIGDIPLQNREIIEFGYTIIETPTYLEEIVSAIENG